MITYQEEKFTNILTEFDKMLSVHMAEMNYFQLNGAKFDPDYEKYIRGQQNNYYTLLTARDDGKLVGYTVFGVCPHIRFKSTLYASEDLYYVDPEYRRRGIARQLFKEMEKILTERGVAFILSTTKTYLDRSGLLEQNGYNHFEKVFVKKIKELT